MVEVMRQLGLRPAGGNHRSISSWIRRLELSTEHFKRQAGPPRQTPIALERVLVAGSRYSRAALKQRLYADGLKQRACEMCGQGELWNGCRITLILDHINGVADDNRLENLRIVCPNCAATLDTHCSKNRARPRGPRDCLRCGKQFDPKTAHQRYCSRSCGQRAPRSSRGVSNLAARRVERPPFDQLIAEVKQLGFSAVGRKYGVSDNAIRKWVIAAERERGRSPADEAA
jgi:hypothetical protein